MKYLQSEEVFGHAAPQPLARLQPGVWHSSWPRVSSPLCAKNDCFGIQTVERDRGEDWGCLSIVSDLCRDQGELLAQGLRTVSCWWQALLGKVSAAQHWGDRGPKRVQRNGFFFLLDRITWFISTKSIWSYSSSTFKHFANEFSIIIPDLQTRRFEVETANTPSPESDNGRTLKADSLRSTRSLIHWTAHLKQDYLLSFFFCFHF